VLFRIIPKEEETSLRQRFAGSQADRASAAASKASQSNSKAAAKAASKAASKAGQKPGDQKPAAPGSASEAGNAKQKQ
jgi:hypothetical protein